MQRGHDQDLAGYMLEHEDVVHLKLPTEFDRKHRCVTSIGWKDPRKKTGDLLAPDRFGPDEVKKAKKVLSVFNTQHQQEPTPFEGTLFKRDKLKVITKKELPAGVAYVEGRGWDTAATEETPGEDPDFTAGVKMRVYDNGLGVVMHVICDRFGPARGDEVLKSTAIADGRDCRQREEQEPGGSGKKVIASHTLLLAGFDYRGEPSTGSKIVRAMPFVVQADAGNISLLQGEWNEHYIDELTRFPNGKHDDQIDASSTIYNDLALKPRKIWGVA